ncbi:MAG: VOC family protein [Pseudomonadota bacterium]
MERLFTPRALGEIAIRCRVMAPMVRFYRDMVGLTVLEGGEEAAITFFSLGESCAGHTAVLALFAPGSGTRPGLHPDGQPQTGGRSSLHHLALSLPWAEQDAVMAWYDHHGLDYRVELFDWIGWRGIFTRDPEGNTVELVAKDPGWSDPKDA